MTKATNTTGAEGPTESGASRKGGSATSLTTPSFDEEVYRQMIYSMHKPMGFFSDLSKAEKILLWFGAFLLCVGVPCSLGFWCWAITMRIGHG